MKPVYMCEFCGRMGDYETIRVHEPECEHNPALRGCKSCSHCENRHGNISCDLTGEHVGEFWSGRIDCPNYKNGKPKIWHYV